MTKLLFLFSTLLLFIAGFAQPECETDFDGVGGWNECEPIIDTISNPNNQWEIGTPQKTVFNSTTCPTNGMVTNLTTPYVANDTSSFYFFHPVAGGNVFRMGFDYMVDSDSLKDYGMIEFSPDNGITWYEILGTNNCFSWANGSIYDPPVLTGKSDGWVHTEASYDFCVFPFLSDTIQFKFSFISDSIFDNRDGLIFDNMFLWEHWFSVDENNLIPSKVYPNPAQETITIELEKATSYGVEVYDLLGKAVMNKTTRFDNVTELDISHFDKGLYTYQLFGENGEVLSMGKFLKN